jgi:hypothetical protein
LCIYISTAYCLEFFFIDLLSEDLAEEYAEVSGGSVSKSQWKLGDMFVEVLAKVSSS